MTTRHDFRHIRGARKSATSELRTISSRVGEQKRRLSVMSKRAVKDFIRCAVIALAFGFLIAGWALRDASANKTVKQNALETVEAQNASDALIDFSELNTISPRMFT